MKNLFAMLLSVSLFSGISAVAFAGSASDKLVGFNNFFDSDEMTTVIEQNRDDSLFSSFKNKSASDRNDSSVIGYKQYDAQDANFLDRLAEGATVGELVSDEYRWVFVSGDATAVAAMNDKGTWYTTKVSVLLDEMTESGKIVDSSVRLDDVNSAVERIGRSNVRDVVCVNLPRRYIKFVCLVSDTTFVIPFASSPDSMGYENGKMYTASEANEIWKKYIDSLPVCNNAEILNGRSIDELTVEELLSLEYWGTGERTVTQTESSSVAKNGIPLAAVLIIPAVSIGAAIAIMMLVWDRRGKKHGK